MAQKKYLQSKQIFTSGRNTRLHDMLQREVVYTGFITQLAQRFAVPLLKTPDKMLKDESQDIVEILAAIIDIERLHRFVFKSFYYSDYLHINQKTKNKFIHFIVKFDFIFLVQ